MGRTLAATLMLLALATAATAQRSAGGHVSGGAHTSFSSHSFSPAASYHYTGGSFAQSSRPAMPALRFNGAVTTRRPVFYLSPRTRRSLYIAPVGLGYGYGYPYAYYPTPYPDPLDDSYASPPDNTPADDDSTPYQFQPELPQPQPQSQPAPPAPLDTTTLIFKDGRPPQQIQNYMATHFTITVFQGQRHFDIPIDDIDIPATQKANHAAGIDFQLP